jgi:acetylornithine deacetylase/succinyl-diaminopimelate desuccinylase family protein
MDIVERPAQSEAVRLLSDLVAINSVNPYFPGGERGEADVAAYVSDYCKQLGLDVHEQPVLPGRSNVIAELKVPGATRTILLDSHMDTVSLDLMGPAGLRPQIRDGIMTGRGSCDTKASLAAMLAALAELARNPAGLRCNVLLLASVDEEYLMRGAQAFAQSGAKVDGAIVGEPTKLDIVIAHKGFVRWRMHTVGRAAHSSNPSLGDNAIYQMADLIHLLRETLEPRFTARTHPLVGPVTWSVGKISGGASVNIVPELCTVEIDRRLLPNETGAAALAEVDAAVEEIRQKRPDIHVRRDEPFGDVSGLDTPARADVVRALEVACGTTRGETKLVGVPYGTNASKFADAGITGVVFGPGDVSQAHTADEFVSIDQVISAAKIYEAAVRAF